MREEAELRMGFLDGARLFCLWLSLFPVSLRGSEEIFSGWMFPNLLMYHGRDNTTVSFKARCGFDKLVSPVKYSLESLVSFG